MSCAKVPSQQSGSTGSCQSAPEAIRMDTSRNEALQTGNGEESRNCRSWISRSIPGECTDWGSKARAQQRDKHVNDAAASSLVSFHQCRPLTCASLSMLKESLDACCS